MEIHWASELTGLFCDWLPLTGHAQRARWASPEPGSETLVGWNLGGEREMVWFEVGLRLGCVF